MEEVAKFGVDYGEAMFIPIALLILVNVRLYEIVSWSFNTEVGKIEQNISDI